MPATRKIVEVIDPRHNDTLICIYDTREPFNPYIVYVQWYDNGPRRRKLTKYGNIESVLHFMLDIITGKQPI